MSIDRDTFKNTSEDRLADLSVPDQVLGYLAVSEDRAFKAREIASQIGADEGAVSTALSRLKDRDLVEHKGDILGDNRRRRATRRIQRLRAGNRTVQQPTRYRGQGGVARVRPGNPPECRGRAVTDEETPIFERGDVVYGDDPFKGEEDARPGSFSRITKAIRSTATSISHSR